MHLVACAHICVQGRKGSYSTSTGVTGCYNQVALFNLKEVLNQASFGCAVGDGVWVRNSRDCAFLQHGIPPTRPRPDDQTQTLVTDGPTLLGNRAWCNVCPILLNILPSDTM